MAHRLEYAPQSLNDSAVTGLSLSALLCSDHLVFKTIIQPRQAMPFLGSCCCSEKSSDHGEACCCCPVDEERRVLILRRLENDCYCSCSRSHLADLVLLSQWRSAFLVRVPCCRCYGHFGNLDRRLSLLGPIVIRCCFSCLSYCTCRATPYFSY